MLQLYKNIKNRRTELHLTQSELADRMGYADKSMIAKIEKGLVDLPQSKILAFAEALKTPPSYLMGWDEDNVDIKLVDKSDEDLLIIQRERNKMSPKERTKLMNILKANFDDYNWEEDDSGDIE